MSAFITKWLVNISALLLVTTFIPGISIDMWQTAVIASLVLGLLNAFLRPLLLLLTLPLNILSLGIFTLIINAGMFYLASRLVTGFSILNFSSAFFGALSFSIISFLLNLFIKPSAAVKVKVSGRTARPKASRDKVIDVEGKVMRDDTK
jgi:putative membrane protein